MSALGSARPAARRRHYAAPFIVAAIILLLTLTSTGRAFAARPEWKVGLAKIAITPRGPLWMAGYAARHKPSEGIELELYAKALALEDRQGRRAVLLTTDMLGFPASLSRRVAEQVEKQFHIPRDHLMLSSSHTHCGPVVDRMPLSIR